MKQYALNTLVCPFCKSVFSLIAFDEIHIDLDESQVTRCNHLGINQDDAGKAIKEGILCCHTCKKWFPIINFIPILLDFPTEIHAVFKEQYRTKTDILDRYKCADGQPREGELFVQKSFTKEWNLLGIDEISFGLTSEQRDMFVSLELDWPADLLNQSPLNILEVGCGSGFESASIDRVSQGCIYGFDLNLSLLQKGHLLASNPFINNSIASLFALPLKSAQFEIVYSSGVLHHTYSTKAAFDSIYQFRKPNGMIYIWLYAQEDVDYSINARIDWIAEAIFRPRIAKLPDFWQNLVVKYLTSRHYQMYKRIGGYSRDKWQYKDSEHFIRDRWTVLFAYRHSFREVITWYLEKDLDYQLINPKKYFEKLNFPLIGIGIRGKPRHDYDKRSLESSINN